MKNAKLGVFFVLLVAAVNLTECKGGHGHGGSHGSHGSHGSRHGSHSRGGGFWSFFGWGKSSSSSSSHTYPKSTGYSGHGSGGAHTYPNSHGLSGSGISHYTASRPTYYTSPQYVYVTRYRETQSPYSNLLTGLTMYNLGRSHNYHHHYYSDDFHRSSSGNSYSAIHNQAAGSNYEENTMDGNKDEAKCVLKIKTDRKIEALKIPCAIVSTFDNGNHTSNDAVNNTTGTNCSSLVNMTLSDNLNLTNGADSNNTFGNIGTNNNTASNPCANITVDIIDPLSVPGVPIDSAEATNMECSVEITTKQEVINNNLDCSALLNYAKMAVPEDKSTNLLPNREKLKSMLDKPPWWLSFFIAV